MTAKRTSRSVWMACDGANYRCESGQHLSFSMSSAFSAWPSWGEQASEAFLSRFFLADSRGHRFHPRGQDYVPINDKLLHFICFLLATGLFYFIWDVDEVSVSLLLLSPS